MGLGLKRRLKTRLVRAWRGNRPDVLPAAHKLRALEACLSFSVANNIVGDYLEFGVFEGAIMPRSRRLIRCL